MFDPTPACAFEGSLRHGCLAIRPIERSAPRCPSRGHRGVLSSDNSVPAVSTTSVQSGASPSTTMCLSVASVPKVKRCPTSSPETYWRTACCGVVVRQQPGGASGKTASRGQAPLGAVGRFQASAFAEKGGYNPACALARATGGRDPGRERGDVLPGGECAGAGGG